MLRPEELRAAQEFTKLVGQRAHGHLDHDANFSAGPFRSMQRSFGRESEQPRENNGWTLVESSDVETGEPIVEWVQTSKAD